ncbi:TROVE domain-containing protein [Spirillospora sp. NPDC048911]|uniref:TROVE domain-containing protein n=1 Tax=Spirillospora sp. NPDC048911 TaxID=3364527 RepID=UPI00371D6836
MGEDTFYEKAGDRDERFTNLVISAGREDPNWTAGFLTWLRAEGNMRSAPLVAAVELVRAKPEGMRTRAVVDSVLQRADEPSEILAYWLSRYGKPIPIALKRGVADAVARLYNERSLLKYDSADRAVRFGDVVDLTQPAYHRPEIRGTWRYDLLGHALDRRHGRDKPIPESLAMLRARAELMALPSAERRAVLTAENGPERLRAAGITWEALAGWLQGPMDAKAWEAIIPSMGYMARLRNLRNWDEAGVSDDVAAQVAARLADPEQVARSRQLPMRFLSAYRAAPSLRWGHALDKALTASISNIPALPGRTLILVDTSSSMDAGFSKDGTLMRWDAAALFGVALAQRCDDAAVVSYSSSARYWGDPQGPRTKAFPLRRGESLLRSLDRWKNDGYFLGGGTDTAGAVRQHFRGHDRVVILTDEQASGGDVGQALPRTTPLYTFNLAGYQRGHAASGDGLRVTMGGLSDAGFRLIPLLEAGRSASWPWMLDKAA